MLSPQSAETVRATLPVVGAHLDQITARFYETMFADRPELLDGLFNRANQANGEQRRALAGSIAGFATALLNRPDERPDAMLSRIAHKHASLAVTDDQYVIVHKYLFGAIAEVLGDALTPEIAAAWDEVYWLMGGALIAMEARIYAEKGADNGRTWREWTITDRREETPDVVSLTLRPDDGAPLPEVRPGQYVSVRMRMPDGVHQLRQYSVSGGDERGRRITVKRVRGDQGAPDGEMSTLLHAEARVGDRLTVSAPFGDVVLADGDHPLVLVSAGIGCTPIVGMLHHLAAAGATRRVLALHADRSRDAHALREETAELVDALPNGQRIVWYEEGDGGRTGQMDLGDVAIPADAEVYLCGPLPFMRDARAQLLAAGVAPRAVHYEVFGPDLWLPEG